MNSQPIIVGISGGSGSGKTTVLSSLLDHYSNSELCIVSQDNYYFPIEKQKKDEQGIVNFDLPESINAQQLVAHMDRLCRGEAVNHIEYTFNNNDRQSADIKLMPARIIVIEGLFVFHIKEIRQLLDLSVFVHADRDIRLSRRIERDCLERGYPEAEVRYQWEAHVEPAYMNFLHPYIEECDLVIDNNETLDNGLHEIIQLINGVPKAKTN